MVEFILLFLLSFATTTELSNALVVAVGPWKSNRRQLPSTLRRAIPSVASKHVISNSGGLSSASLDDDILSPSNWEAVTSMVLRISFDGGRFTGWSSGTNTVNENAKSRSSSTNNHPNQQQPRISKRQRRRGMVLPDAPKGFVRSVEGVLRTHLARLYGNVNPERIVVEGSSRTDKGVHAQGMVAMVYCLTLDAYEALESSSSNEAMDCDKTREMSSPLPTSSVSTCRDDKAIESSAGERKATTTTTIPTTSIHCSIPGKRKPHPISRTDQSYFELAPMDGNLSKVAFSLNRMLPPDVRVTGIASTPDMGELEITTPAEPGSEQNSDHRLPFHPSLNAVGKTYEYKISVGAMHDPTQWRFFWHISNAPQGELHVKKMEEACRLLEGSHNFSAFQGAPRGSDEKRRRQNQQQLATFCTLSHVEIRPLPAPLQGPAIPTPPQHLLPSTMGTPLVADNSVYFPGLDPPLRTYIVTVTGNRFLYKMMRFLVGAIVAVGTGFLDLQDIQHALDNGTWQVSSSISSSSTEQGGGMGKEEAMDASIGPMKDISCTLSRKEFQCAPPHGLSLQHVDYGDDISIDWQPLWY